MDTQQPVMICRKTDNFYNIDKMLNVVGRESKNTLCQTMWNQAMVIL